MLNPLCLQRALPVKHAAARTLLLVLRQNHKLEQRQEVCDCVIEGVYTKQEVCDCVIEGVYTKQEVCNNVFEGVYTKQEVCYCVIKGVYKNMKCVTV